MAHLDKFVVLVGHLDTSWHMILARCGDGFTEGMEMLEASRMDRTDVTQGGLEELCELSLRGKSRRYWFFLPNNSLELSFFLFFASNI